MKSNEIKHHAAVLQHASLFTIVSYLILPMDGAKVKDVQSGFEEQVLVWNEFINRAVFTETSVKVCGR